MDLSRGTRPFGEEEWKVLSTARAFLAVTVEAFGLAVAEAVSIGVPTIVTPFPLGRFLANEGAVTAEVPAAAEAIAEAVEFCAGLGFRHQDRPPGGNARALLLGESDRGLMAPPGPGPRAAAHLKTYLLSAVPTPHPQ